MLYYQIQVFYELLRESCWKVVTMICLLWYNVKCEYIHNTGHLNHLFQTNLCEYMEYNHIGDWGGGGVFEKVSVGEGVWMATDDCYRL